MDLQKVSIIIPVYNVEKYIKQCLKSVLNQTYKNLEIILVNDGTKDNSMKVIEEYLQDERIIIINKENGGLSSARNSGLDKVTGEYIYFLDSDDWLEENALEILINNSSDIDIVRGNFNYYDEIKNTKRLPKFRLEYNKNLEGKFLLQDGVEVMVWNKLYKTSFIKKNNLKFVEGIIHEDEEFTFKTYMLNPKVKYLEKVTYNYRVNRANSITNDSKKNSSINSLGKIIENFEKQLKFISNPFIKLRYILRVYYLKVFFFRGKDKVIPNEEINKFENIIVNFDLKSFNLKEKEIILKDFRYILFQKEFKNFSFLNKFYWKNDIFTIFHIKKIISRKIKNIYFKREGNK